MSSSFRHSYPNVGTVPYFFSFKTEFFSFQNNPKNLDLSYETDLDLWDCLGRVELVLQQNFVGLIKLYLVILVRRKSSLIAE